MITVIGRYSTLGVWVCFRLENTMELLWKSPMKLIPRPNDQVGHLANGEVSTWYKVESVKFEFQDEEGEYIPEDGSPIPYVPERSDFGVCVIVSEVV